MAGLLIWNTLYYTLHWTGTGDWGVLLVGEIAVAGLQKSYYGLHHASLPALANYMNFEFSRKNQYLICIISNVQKLYN